MEFTARRALPYWLNFRLLMPANAGTGGSQSQPQPVTVHGVYRAVGKRLRPWPYQNTPLFVVEVLGERGGGGRPQMWAAVPEFGRDIATEPRRNRPRVVRPELAFYRKYTEGMLRRYVSMSLEAGRVPSLLGKEMFRGNVTSYRVHGFDDVVIFIHDMESCMAKLDPSEQRLILRIAVQRFTLQEVAEMVGNTRKTVLRQYNEALNRLTGILLDVRLLEPFVDYRNCCQEGGTDQQAVS